MDTLEKLEEKINKALALIEKLTTDNRILKEDNERLKKELSESKVKAADLERQENERSEKVRERLGSILNKLDNLEKIS
jgi:FtsZ-binding cell division protein ZapB